MKNGRAGWRATLEDFPEYGDIDAWPVIDVDHLVSSGNLKDFHSRKRVVAAVLKGEKMSDVARRHAITPAAVTQFMDRCFTLDEFGTPVLSLGLIPHYRICPKVRKAPLPCADRPVGYSGAFQKLLSDYPDLEKLLQKRIEADHRKKKTYFRSATKRGFQKYFRQVCLVIGIGLGSYPFSTLTTARYSVSAYYERQREILDLKSQDQACHTWERNYLAKAEPLFLEEVQLDEHKVHCRLKVRFEEAGEQVTAAVDKPELVIAVERKSYVILAWWLTMVPTASSEDVLECVQRMFAKEPPTCNLPAGLSRPETACFIQELPHRSVPVFETLYVDNANSHKDRKLIRFVRDTLGATLRLGHPHDPTGRELVEGVIKTIVNDLEHKLPSTSGSGPADPRRSDYENDRHSLPVVTWELFNQLLYVVIAEYNSRRVSHLYNNSPIERFEECYDALAFGIAA